MTPNNFLCTALLIIAGFTLSLVIYLIAKDIHTWFKYKCSTKKTKLETNPLFDLKWEILGAYRERCFEHYNNIKCDMYATNDPHNLKVLTIELVEHDKKREFDLAIFNLIELQSKTNFQYDALKFKFISVSEFEEYKQICTQLNHL